MNKSAFPSESPKTEVCKKKNLGSFKCNCLRDTPKKSPPFLSISNVDLLKAHKIGKMGLFLVKS
jgi:hypothetical protein